MNVSLIFNKFTAFFPFTIINMVLRNLDKDCHSILDVGCGFGRPMNTINKRKKFFTLGLDSYIPALKACMNKGIHDANLLCDIRFLPIRSKSFDIILCLEVIEHLSKCDGLILLEKINRIATREIIITTPVGFASLNRVHKRQEENPCAFHISGWFPSKFESMEYKVRGIIGLKCISGAKEGGLGSRFTGNDILSKVKKYFIFMLNYIIRPLAYFIPNSAFRMLCVKRIN